MHRIDAHVRFVGFENEFPSSGIPSMHVHTAARLEHLST